MKKDKRGLGENKDKRLSVRFTQTQWTWVLNRILKTGENAGTIVRDCVNKTMSEEK